MFLFFNKYDLIFFCSSSEDEVWVRSTIQSLDKYNLNICLLIVNNKDYNIINYYKNRKLKIKNIKNTNEIKKYKAKVLVSASTGLNRSIFSNNIKYFVHMPHSLVSLHGVYPNDAFDAFNVIFASGAHHENEFKELKKIRGKSDIKIYKTGYGKLDILAEKKDFVADDNHILIAPSWGEGNIIETVGLQLVNELLNKGYKVTLRPHCIFFYNKKEFLKPFLDISNSQFCIENFSDSTSIFTSNALITDFSGISFEYYLLQKRKIIFVDTKPKIFNQDYFRFTQELVEISKRAEMGVIIPPDVESIISAITTAYSTSNAAEIDYIYNHGKCGNIASNQIMELLAL